MTERPIAALYVERGGAYWDLPGVDPWDEMRDARLYAGPHPVVAHPPCQRWGRYWGGGPSAKVKRAKGDDNGCFAAALAAVRRWGGVLEHPEASHAWRAFGLVEPPWAGAWVRADWMDGFDGWTCCVDQGAYGHRARKKTWLYAHGVEVAVASLGPRQRAAFCALTKASAVLKPEGLQVISAPMSESPPLKQPPRRQISVICCWVSRERFTPHDPPPVRAHGPTLRPGDNMTRNEWNHAQGGLSVAERREADLADLAARLRHAYPDTTPVDHMRFPAWIADVTAWARLGERR